jgi:hypothetical protein
VLRALLDAVDAQFEADAPILRDVFAENARRWFSLGEADDHVVRGAEPSRGE